MPAPNQLEFLEHGTASVSLPTAFEPVAPPRFAVQRIVLAKASLDTPEREAFVRGICEFYSGVPVEERLDVAHNRIELGGDTPAATHAEGKRTLVFGVLKSAVRFSEERGNTCPNYRHFSVYGFCPYGCSYCYLAGTQGVWFSPTVKIYVNLPEVLKEIARTVNRLARPTSFYHGKLQDGLALDPLTAYSTVLMPFFARHAYARQVLLTKSASIERLLASEHNGHTTLSWSLNPPEVAARFEANAPSVEERIEAMQRCSAAGYPVRAVIMPIIPVTNWEDQYTEFIQDLVSRVPLERLTMGGICSYGHALQLMEGRLGRENAISCNLVPNARKGDGRIRYAPELRIRLYGHLIKAARGLRPDLTVALCLEERAVWEHIHKRWPLGRCNCVL